MTKNYQFNSEGKLFILPWSFGKTDADYSTTAYRCVELARCKVTQGVIQITHNPYADYWILKGKGHGFSGSQSKIINVVKTKSKSLFEKWKNAIENGNVEIL